MPERIEMPVEDVVLAILHGRAWGMTYDQIAGDPAWSAIRDSTRAEQDYDYGVPTTRTLDATIVKMLAELSIQRINLAPPSFRLLPGGRQRARALAQVLADHIG
jgi:hypothetical protein